MQLLQILKGQDVVRDREHGDEEAGIMHHYQLCRDEHREEDNPAART